MGRTLLALVCGVLGAGASLFAAAPRAHACTCTEGADVVWPAPDATDVPLDAAMVVSSRGKAPGALEVRLEDEAGTAQPVEVMRTLEGTRDCESSFVFLRPTATLTPGRSYRLRVFDPDAASGAPLATRLFVTAQDEVAIAKPEPLSVRYLHVSQDPAACEGERCHAAQLLVEPSGEEVVPAWLIVQPAGNADEPRIVQRNGPDGLASLASVGVWLDDASRCVRYELIDVRGDTVEERELCEPDACVRLERRDTEAVSTCDSGAPPYVEPSVWDELPRDSCMQPGGAAPISFGDDVGGGEADGCSVALASRRASWGGAAALAFASMLLMALRRRDRRRERSPSPVARPTP